MDATTTVERTSTWLDTTVLVVIAGAVVLPGLGSPPVLVFDEIYYVSDAASHLDVGVGASFQAHPPLGTWLIAAGMALVNGPVGWRIAPALLGILAVALLHRLALRLFPETTTSRVLAGLVALLLVTDGSWLVLSRTAMLDGPLTTFVLAAAAAAAAVRGARTTWTRWLLLVLAGASVGAATAVKWSGALAAPIVVAVLAIPPSETSLRDHLHGIVRALPGVAVSAVLVYAVAWVPFALHRGDVQVLTCPDVAAPCPTKGGASGVIDQHTMQVRYHTHIRADATTATRPDRWPLMQHPVGFFRPDCHETTGPVADPLVLDNDCSQLGEVPDGADTILYSGNAVVWLGFLSLLPLLAAGARAGERPSRIALLGWSLLWLPWLAATRTSYLWYLAPAVPFAALGVVAAASVVPRAAIIPIYIRASAGAGLGALIALATPLGGAIAIVGWALGGMWPTPDRPLRPQERAAAAQLVVATTITVVACLAAVVLRSSWTAAG